jgi:hypothetical protein
VQLLGLEWGEKIAQSGISPIVAVYIVAIAAARESHVRDRPVGQFQSNRHNFGQPTTTTDVNAEVASFTLFGQLYTSPIETLGIHRGIIASAVNRCFDALVPHKDFTIDAETLVQKGEHIDYFCEAVSNIIHASTNDTFVQAAIGHLGLPPVSSSDDVMKRLVSLVWKSFGKEVSDAATTADVAKEVEVEPELDAAAMSVAMAAVIAAAAESQSESQLSDSGPSQESFSHQFKLVYGDDSDSCSADDDDCVPISLPMGAMIDGKLTATPPPQLTPRSPPPPPPRQLRAPTLYDGVGTFGVVHHDHDRRFVAVYEDGETDVGSSTNCNMPRIKSTMDVGAVEELAGLTPPPPPRTRLQRHFQDGDWSAGLYRSNCPTTPTYSNVQLSPVNQMSIAASPSPPPPPPRLSRISQTGPTYSGACYARSRNQTSSI